LKEKKEEDPKKKIHLSINTAKDKDDSKAIINEKPSLDNIQKDNQSFPFSPMKKTTKNDKEKSKEF